MKKSIAGNELKAKLEADPEWVAQRDRREHEHQVAIECYRQAQRPLVDRLRSIGIPVTSVYELQNLGFEYPNAIPLLLQHAAMNYPPAVRESIIHALCKRWAHDQVWDHIVAQYLAEPNKEHQAKPGEIGAPSRPKDVMADGLSQIARPNNLGQLIDLICDKHNGPSRIFFIKNLTRSRSRKALETLVRLRKDPDLHKEIEYRLRAKLRRQSTTKQGRQLKN